MPEIIQIIFPWDKDKEIGRKRNTEIGELISIFITFLYYLLYLFGISGGVYPYLLSADIQFLENVSNGVEVLGYIANRWWLIILMFIISLCITSLLSLILSKTTISKIRTYNTFLKQDIKELGILEKIKKILSDILIIAGYSILIFIILELITMAITTIIMSFFISNILSNYTTQSLASLYLIFLTVHVIVFPSITYIYIIYNKKRKKSKSMTDYSEFLKEDGDIDMEKWRARTWGKKPYSYDWKDDDYVPITCLSCGSIISSNFSECPICKADLLEEIEEIDVEYHDSENERNSEEENDSN